MYKLALTDHSSHPSTAQAPAPALELPKRLPARCKQSRQRFRGTAIQADRRAPPEVPPVAQPVQLRHERRRQRPCIDDDTCADLEQKQSESTSSTMDAGLTSTHCSWKHTACTAERI